MMRRKAEEIVSSADGAENAERVAVPRLRFKGCEGVWEKKRLGEIGVTYNGLSGKSKSDFGHGDACYVTYLGVFNNAVANPNECGAIEIDSSQNEVREGDVFFTTSSETPDEVGMSSVWRGDGSNTYLNSFCFGYRPNDKIEIDFWARMLRSPAFRKKIIFLAQGISRYNISKRKVMDLYVALPCYKEQSKIGEYYKCLDQTIDLASSHLSSLRQLKQAMLVKMFPQPGQCVPEIRFKGFEGKWEEKRLGMLCDISTGHRDVNEGSATGRYPFFTCSKTVYRADTFSFDGEAVLIAGNGDVGNLHYTNGKFEAYQRTYVLMRFQADASYVLQFLDANLMSELNKQKFGSSMPYIVMGQLTNFIMQLPSLPEQRKIGAFFRNLDRLIGAAEKKVSKLRQVKASLLERMFV